MVGWECRRAERDAPASRGMRGGSEGSVGRSDASRSRPELDVRTLMGEASEGRPAAFGRAGREDLGTSASGV